MATATATTRMSHRIDPDTSPDAARLASLGTKEGTIQSAILLIIASGGPATAKEMYREYFMLRRHRDWPSADLYDIRRRLTELKKTHLLVIDTGDRRDGEAVMDLATKEER